MFTQMRKLYNGVRIPVLGLGTWQIPDGVAEGAVKDAIEVGYRHIDTAAAYGNEGGVGRGIKASGIDRKSLFVTSKIPAEYKNYEIAKKTIEDSLRLLQTDYIDLMLIHSPRPWDEIRGPKSYNEENLQVWKAMEEAYAAGKLRAIGVSNFNIADLENILKNSKVKPAVHQFCCFIGSTPTDLIDYGKEHEIVSEAYSPIATGRLLKKDEPAMFAARYGVTVPQLCIRYVMQLGMVALPKTTHRAYMEQNARLNFTISDEDMAHFARMEF